MCVSIAIPVYNEAKFIKHTLNSVVEQEADEIIISDNASTDGTSEICQEYAHKYKHIKYHRFDVCRSVRDNFLNCLLLAKNKYYMVIGGHDLLSKNYVTELKKVLVKTKSVLAYTNAVHLTHNYAFSRFYEYQFANLLSDDSPHTRVLATIEHLSNCSLYYGLYRREIFLAAYYKQQKFKYNGIDHALLSRIATFGKMTLCPSATFYRIDPPRTEHIEKKWARVLKSFFADKYDPNVHIPELIPLGIAYTQFLIAKSLDFSEVNEKEYLEKTVSILFKRWMINEEAVRVMVAEFHPLLQQSGIDITKIKLDS